MARKMRTTIFAACWAAVPFVLFANVPLRAQEGPAEESSVLVQPQASSAPAASQAEPEQAAPAATATPPLPPPQQSAGEPAASQLNDREVTRQPFLRPAEPEPGRPEIMLPRNGKPSMSEERLPGPAEGEIVFQPTPRIVTHASGSARRMFRRSGEIELVMAVKNPADGCLYEIPLCVPACCVGEPQIDSWCGLFGRGVVEFCWECGFSAKVKFRHVLADVKVEYDG